MNPFTGNGAFSLDDVRIELSFLSHDGDENPEKHFHPRLSAAEIAALEQKCGLCGQRFAVIHYAEHEKICHATWMMRTMFKKIV